MSEVERMKAELSARADEFRAQKEREAEFEATMNARQTYKVRARVTFSTRFEVELEGLGTPDGKKALVRRPPTNLKACLALR
ncbi:MAG: hypothetical protein KY475_22275 [Planctomycetes bacterium]|nr:hypothetical protein [Planctomycetota bacterium]